MGVYTEDLSQEVRLEYMRPEQVAAARTKRPAIYVAFGSIEWHGYHNVVGLDALKAHEQLVGLAARVGGVVYPPVFFGSGGGHGEWPSSFMVSPEPMRRIVTELLRGFERDGYETCVLLSGHYPNRTQYLDGAIEDYAGAGGTMRVMALVENQAPGVGGDHASLYETSFMMYLHPGTVDAERMRASPTDDVTGPDVRKNWMGDEYEGHPNYGLVGADPRGNASAEIGRVGTERLIEHLAAWVMRGD